MQCAEVRGASASAAASCTAGAPLQQAPACRGCCQRFLRNPCAAAPLSCGALTPCRSSPGSPPPCWPASPPPPCSSSPATPVPLPTACPASLHRMPVLAAAHRVPSYHTLTGPHCLGPLAPKQYVAPCSWLPRCSAAPPRQLPPLPLHAAPLHLHHRLGGRFLHHRKGTQAGEAARRGPCQFSVAAASSTRLAPGCDDGWVLLAGSWLCTAMLPIFKRVPAVRHGHITAGPACLPAPAVAKLHCSPGVPCCCLLRCAVGEGRL